MWMGGIVALYLIVPIAFFLYRLLESHHRGFNTPGLWGAFYISVLSATISTALIALFGVPLAYILSKSKGRIATVVGVLVQLPIALPPLMGGILLIYLVGPYTTIGHLFNGDLTDSIAGVVLAQTFVASPFLIITARSAFNSVDPALYDLAATLGRRRWSRFTSVGLQVASPGIRAGLLLAWLRAFGEYGATVTLAYHPFSIPIYSYNQFSGIGLPSTQAPTALALGVAGLALLVSRIKFSKFKRRSAQRSTQLTSAVDPKLKTTPSPLTNPAIRPASTPVSTPVSAPVSTPVSTPISTPVPTPVCFQIDYRVGNFHLEIAHLEKTRRLAILGPSGSGKSTALRSIAGIYGAEPGDIWYGEKYVSDIAIEQRQVGYVAQGSVLFPHLTVAEHFNFAHGSNADNASFWIERLGLDGLQERFPSQLSGGQLQRVALGQALAYSPRVLLLDEPFSALDKPIRDRLGRELYQLQQEMSLASVLVTHDPKEAALLADHILVISDGKVLQSASTREVFSEPNSPEVADILGIENFFQAEVVDTHRIDSDGRLLCTNTRGYPPKTKVWWSIRPESVELTISNSLTSSISSHNQKDTNNTSAMTSDTAITCEVIDKIDLGNVIEITLKLGQQGLLKARYGEPNPRGLERFIAGTSCTVILPSEKIHIWPMCTVPKPS